MDHRRRGARRRNSRTTATASWEQTQATNNVADPERELERRRQRFRNEIAPTRPARRQSPPPSGLPDDPPKHGRGGSSAPEC